MYNRYCGGRVVSNLIRESMKLTIQDPLVHAPRDQQSFCQRQALVLDRVPGTGKNVP